MYFGRDGTTIYAILVIVFVLILMAGNLNNNSVRYVSANVQLSRFGEDNFTREWWGIVQNIELSPYILGGDRVEQNDFIEMIIYSSNVAPPLFRQVAGLG